MRILAEPEGAPSPPRRGPAPFVLALGGLLVVAGAGFWLLGRSSKPPVPASAPARPPASAAAAAGALEITANVSGAIVSLDGRRLGPAPQKASGLAPGGHKVRVEKEGYPPFEQDVHVLPGYETRVAARLLAEPAGFRVDSDVPGASVFLDRKYVGVTPVEVPGVAPGSHRLNVSAEGYEMYSETIDVSAAAPDVMVRFKEVRLDAAVDVIHRHGLGSCQGRLAATPAGLRYEASRKEDAFQVPLPALERFEVDYLKKTLRLTLRGGRTYNFTEKSGNADALLAFQQKVEAARKRL